MGADSAEENAIEPGSDTRSRILDATTAVLIEQGYDQLSLERVATRAGTVRATIYYQFGSKSGLIEALISSIEDRERIQESREHDHTIRALLRRVSGIWERHRDVLRAVFGMTSADPQTREVVHRHQLGRRQRIVELVEELDRSGKLRVARHDAVDAIWLLTSFSTYDFLRQHDSRSADETLGLLELLAENLTTAD